MGKPPAPPRHSAEARRVIMLCPPSTIADVHAIVESCEYLAVVRTLEPEAAVIELIATPDTIDDTLDIARLIERRLGAEILHPRPATR